MSWVKDYGNGLQSQSVFPPEQVSVVRKYLQESEEKISAMANQIEEDVDWKAIALGLRNGLQRIAEENRRLQLVVESVQDALNRMESASNQRTWKGQQR